MGKREYIQLELPFDDTPVEAKGEPVKATAIVVRNKPEAAVAPVDTRMRAKRRRIRVTFSDGTIFCDISATATMIMTIGKIGIERVAALNMENCHVPLVSRQVVDKYAEWTKQMADGWYLMAQGDTDQKYRQLKSIITSLSVDAIIELGDFETIVTNENSRKGDTRKRKSRLVVTLQDGMVICGDNPLDTFKKTVRHIGVERVEKTNLKIGGNPITTSVKNLKNSSHLQRNLYKRATSSAVI